MSAEAEHQAFMARFTAQRTRKPLGLRDMKKDQPSPKHRIDGETSYVYVRVVLLLDCSCNHVFISFLAVLCVQATLARARVCCMCMHSSST
jgi:hypothetical protein